MNNKYIYIYDNIDHIINRIKFDGMLYNFIKSCNELNINIIEKIDDKYYILSKTHVGNLLVNIKKEIIDNQIGSMKKINLIKNTLIDYINCIINSENIIKKFQLIDNIDNMIDDIYDNELLKMHHYTSSIANILYNNYVDFIKKPVKYIEHYTMLNK